MVVMVDNPVIGDSRMLKIADTAYNAGYDVTLLGLAKRTPPAGRHGPVPLYRVTVEPRRHLAHQAASTFRQQLPGLLPASPWQPETPWQRPQELAVRAVRAGGRRTGLRSRAGAVARRLQRPRLSGAFRRQLEFLHDGPLDEETTRTASEEWNQHVLTDGRYRWLWPHMEDVEQAFVEALMDLDPDLIHAADRFCLVAADTYARARRASGRPVPWVYDAHEWIPGQVLHGGPHAKTAWLAAEHELAPRADAVIAVSEELADRMQTRHRLSRRPTVVVNAPVSVRVPMDPAERRPLRQEVGVGEDVPLLVYVGKLSELRGVLTVVRALSLLPGVHAALVGSQDVRTRDELRELAASLGVADRLHLLDYVPAACVTWYISSADIGLSPLLPTAAHHAALPTKIRECLQAGLPLVVSDMRAQGAFVRDHSLGAVHQPDDEHSLADAVRTVLDDLPRYRAAITEELLAEHTWEGQERHLVALWRSLVAAPDPGPNQVLPGEIPADRRTPWHDPAALGVVGRAHEVSDSLRSVLESDGLPAPLVDPGGTPALDPAAGTGRIRASLTHWLLLQDGPRRLLYTEPTVHCPVLHPSLATEVAALRATGHEVAVLLDPLTHVSPQDLFSAVPEHPLSERSPEVSARYARQVRRNRRSLRDLDARLLTTGLNAAGLLNGGIWLPFPVAPVPSVAGEATTLKVLVAPGPRAARETTLITSLVEDLRTSGKVSVTHLDHRSVADTAVLSTHHVLVDALCLGEHSRLAARALAHGLMVFTGVRSQVAENVFRAHLADLGLDPDVVAEVLVTGQADEISDVLQERLEDLGSKSLDGRAATAALARQVASDLHGPRSAHLALEKAFRLL